MAGIAYVASRIVELIMGTSNLCPVNLLAVLALASSLFKIFRAF